MADRRKAAFYLAFPQLVADQPPIERSKSLLKFPPIWGSIPDPQIGGEAIMKSMRRLILTLLFGLFAGGVFLSAASKADTMLWPVKSLYAYRVQVEFYSESRKWEWPGGGQAYSLNDSRTHRYSLTCNSGEKVCMGAWVTGNDSKYWGVGLNNKHSCRNCCYVCGAGDIPRQVLE